MLARGRAFTSSSESDSGLRTSPPISSRHDLGVDLRDVEVDQQVVEPDRRQVVAQRLERHAVVPRRERQLDSREVGERVHAEKLRRPRAGNKPCPVPGTDYAPEPVMSPRGAEPRREGIAMSSSGRPGARHRTGPGWTTSRRTRSGFGAGGRSVPRRPRRPWGRTGGPDSRTISAAASSQLRPRRYGRSLVIASSASATANTRAPSGISVFWSPSG